MDQSIIGRNIDSIIDDPENQSLCTRARIVLSTVVPMSTAFNGETVSVTFRRPVGATGTNKDLRQCRSWWVSNV
jgi:hypothetical protein